MISLGGGRGGGCLKRRADLGGIIGTGFDNGGRSRSLISPSSSSDKLDPSSSSSSCILSLLVAESSEVFEFSAFRKYEG